MFYVPNIGLSARNATVNKSGKGREKQVRDQDNLPKRGHDKRKKIKHEDILLRGNNRRKYQRK